MQTIDEMLAVTGASTKNRAERRRDLALSRRQSRYAETGFRDSARYVGSVVDRTRRDSNGNPLRAALSPKQITERAVERQIINVHRYKQAAAVLSPNDLVRLFDTRAPHALRSTAERRHADRGPSRARAKAAFWAGVAFNEMGKSADGKRSLTSYGHSSATQQEAPLAMAA